MQVHTVLQKTDLCISVASVRDIELRIVSQVSRIKTEYTFDLTVKQNFDMIF